MSYKGIVLPATGGGVFLFGALGLITHWWIALIVSVILFFTILWFIKLLIAQKRLAK